MNKFQITPYTPLFLRLLRDANNHTYISRKALSDIIIAHLELIYSIDRTKIRSYLTTVWNSLNNKEFKPVIVNTQVDQEWQTTDFLICSILDSFVSNSAYNRQKFSDILIKLFNLTQCYQIRDNYPNIQSFVLNTHDLYHMVQAYKLSQKDNDTLTCSRISIPLSKNGFVSYIIFDETSGKISESTVKPEQNIIDRVLNNDDALVSTVLLAEKIFDPSLGVIVHNYCTNELTNLSTHYINKHHLNHYKLLTLITEEWLSALDKGNNFYYSENLGVVYDMDHISFDGLKELIGRGDYQSLLDDSYESLVQSKLELYKPDKTRDYINYMFNFHFYRIFDKVTFNAIKEKYLTYYARNLSLNQLIYRVEGSKFKIIYDKDYIVNDQTLHYKFEVSLPTTTNLKTPQTSIHDLFLNLRDSENNVLASYQLKSADELKLSLLMNHHFSHLTNDLQKDLTFINVMEMGFQSDFNQLFLGNTLSHPENLVISQSLTLIDTDQSQIISDLREQIKEQLNSGLIGQDMRIPIPVILSKKIGEAFIDQTSIEGMAAFYTSLNMSPIDQGTREYLKNKFKQEVLNEPIVYRRSRDQA